MPQEEQMHKTRLICATRSRALPLLCVAASLFPAMKASGLEGVLKNVQSLPAQGENRFWPTAFTMGPYGTVLVADSVSRTIQTFDNSGNRVSSFETLGPNGTLGSSLYYGIQLDNDGNILTASRWGDESLLIKYSPSGTLLSAMPRSFGLFRVASNNSLFVSAGFSAIDRLNIDGSVDEIIPEQDSTRLVDFQLQADGSIHTLSFIDGSALRVPDRYFIKSYDHQGTPLKEFEIPHPLDPQAATYSLNLIDNHYVILDDTAGTIRKYSLDGDLLDLQQGIPLVRYAQADTNGDLLALFGRTVVRIEQTMLNDRQSTANLFFDRTTYTDRGIALLEEAGIDYFDPPLETTATTFRIPGTPGDLIELTLDFTGSSSPHRKIVGLYDVSQVTADPFLDPELHRAQAFNAAVVSVSNALPRSLSEPFSTTFIVEAGTEVGFFHVQAYVGQRMSELLATPEQLEDRHILSRLPGNIGSWFHLSDPRANFGRVDQFVTFLNEDATIVSLEDLPLVLASDVDLVDFVFRINARLIPVPEPTAICSLALSIALVSLCRIRWLRRSCCR